MLVCLFKKFPLFASSYLLPWALSVVAAQVLRCVADLAHCFCCKVGDAIVSCSPEQCAEIRCHVFMKTEN